MIVHKHAHLAHTQQLNYTSTPTPTHPHTHTHSSQVVTNNGAENLEVIYSDATYEYIGSSDNNEPQSTIGDRRDSLEDNSAYNSVFTDSQTENDGRDAPADKQTFRLVRNDSYESTLYEGEYSYPTAPMDNIYEETVQ